MDDLIKEVKKQAAAAVKANFDVCTVRMDFFNSGIKVIANFDEARIKNGKTAMKITYAGEAMFEIPYKEIKSFAVPKRGQIEILLKDANLRISGYGLGGKI
jgi:hypothetical protein